MIAFARAVAVNHAYGRKLYFNHMRNTKKVRNSKRGEASDVYIRTPPEGSSTRGALSRLGEIDGDIGIRSHTAGEFIEGACVINPVPNEN